MNYDAMSVHDLVCEALALQERAQLTGDREPFTDAMFAEIESAFRKAVIREVSVGVVRLKMSDGDSCWRGFSGTNHEEDLPDGDYDIILHKETA